ncbi:MAG: hypothetical protein H8D87_18930 [Deltaproteobacteria bacterium]|uniref:DUF6206 family protein n=1 Tax=Desulfobacula sp. TaxID=2593537 RepID=UPI0019C932D6|nr:hypothetical protein [Candidatus Desulfobacula maris]MBL6994375.1 hypothetical protein [Desulfobacula sp.]
MDIDIELLNRFEHELIPHDLSRSSIPAKIIGFGEISAIFQIGEQENIIYKRIPIFPDFKTAESYKQMYFEYCALLRQAGIKLPEDDAVIVQVPGHPVVIYFAQQRFDAQFFCHNLINTLGEADRIDMLAQIMSALTCIWNFNKQQMPQFEIAIDCQLSNWAWMEENGKRKLFLVDTSTPFVRKNGIEQLEVELLLQSVPVYIRWLVRRLDLDDVIGRYYDHKKVVIDLVANLYKEQRPDLIPWFLEIVNKYLEQELSQKEIDKYYKEDKMIWTLFSVLRKTERFITVHLLKKRYEFILPGAIKR